MTDMSTKDARLVEDEYLTSDQLAERLKVTESMLRKMRYAGDGPEYVKVGRAVRYPVSRVEEWLLSAIQEREAVA